MNTSSKITDVDFYNMSHTNAIIKLSQRNDFHNEDIPVVCGDVEKAQKYIDEMYIKNNIDMDKITRKKMTNQLMESLREKAYKLNPNYKGFLISKGKKVVGFILCHICSMHNFGRVDIHFLLIDKKYQTMGLGTTLVNHIKNKYEK